MKRTLIVAVSTVLCFSGAPAFADDPRKAAESRGLVKAESSDWSMGDHMAKAKELEVKALRLQGEASGLETAERALQPYVDVKAIEESGLTRLADRRIEEAKGMLELASFHREQALKLGAQEQIRKVNAPRSRVKESSEAWDWQVYP